MKVATAREIAGEKGLNPGGGYSKMCIYVRNRFRWSLDNQQNPFEMSAFPESGHTDL